MRERRHSNTTNPHCTAPIIRRHSSNSATQRPLPGKQRWEEVGMASFHQSFERAIAQPHSIIRRQGRRGGKRLILGKEAHHS